MKIKLQARNSSSGEADAEKQFPQELDKITIGRHPDSFIHLNSAHISKEHAIIVRDGSSYFLIDRSTNGTLLNGIRIERDKRTPIKPGDLISIAEYQISVTGEGMPVKTVATPTAQVPSRPVQAPVSDYSAYDEAFEEEEEMLSTYAPTSFEDVIKTIDPGDEASYLVFVGGERDGQRIELRGSTSEIFIGRGQNCQVRIQHPAIAQTHAKVRMDWAGITVYDLNTQGGSGVFINGVRITSSRKLHNGDEISFGVPVSVGGVKLILYDRHSLSSENLMGLPPPITSLEPEKKTVAQPEPSQTPKSVTPENSKPPEPSKPPETEQAAPAAEQEPEVASASVLALLDLNRQIYAGITLREAIVITALLLVILIFCMIAFSFLGI